MLLEKIMIRRTIQYWIMLDENGCYKAVYYFFIQESIDIL